MSRSISGKSCDAASHARSKCLSLSESCDTRSILHKHISSGEYASILWLDARWENGKEWSGHAFVTWPEPKMHWIFHPRLKHESVCPAWITIKSVEEAKLYSYKSSPTIYIHKWFTFHASTMHWNFLICIVIFSSSIHNYTYIVLCFPSFHVCTQLEAEGLALWRITAKNISVPVYLACELAEWKWLGGCIIHPPQV